MQNASFIRIFLWLGFQAFLAHYFSLFSTSDMFAVILSGAKQYLVKEGDTITVEKLDIETGKNHTFDKVLLLSKDGKSVELGKPFLKNTVTATVTEQGKADKIRIFKKKPKKGYERRQGHRQPYTKLTITKIA